MTPGQRRVASEYGACICSEESVEINGRCVEKYIFAIVGSVVALAILSIAGYFYVRHKNHKADEIWQVNIDDLQFDDPAEIIGQGSYGVVLLADVRFTLFNAIWLGMLSPISLISLLILQSIVNNVDSTEGRGLPSSGLSRERLGARRRRVRKGRKVLPWALPELLVTPLLLRFHKRA